jgi:hypothetical protein
MIVNSRSYMYRKLHDVLRLSHTHSNTHDGTFLPALLGGDDDYAEKWRRQSQQQQLPRHPAKAE